jgi:Tfp pilus assembly protein PilE
MEDGDGCSATVAILDVLCRGTHMVRKRRLFTPLEIPKPAPLETQAKQSLMGLVRIWDEKRKFLMGFTIVELILIVLFLGILAAIAVPRLQFATLHRKQADAGARKIVTDLRRTRTLAISNAVTHPDGYMLKVTGSSSYEIDIIDGSIVDTLTIDSTISCTGGTEFRFGCLGTLQSGSGTQLTVAADGKTFTITIISATGTVKCQEN